MKQSFEILKLSAIAIGMAITISCNTILVSLFQFVNGGTLLLSIAIAGVCMGVIVLCFSELASKFPGAIGIRAFTKAAFGNRFSLAVTLFYVFMVILIGGLEIYLCHLLLQQVLAPMTAIIVLGALVLFVLWINLTGYELSLHLQIAMTLAVVAMMLALANMAFSEPAILQASVALAGDGDLLNSIPRALFLFIGVEWAIIHVSRHESFKATLPIALIIAVIGIAALYSNFAYALVARLDIQSLNASLLPHLDLARTLDSTMAKWLVIVISLLAVLSSFNVGLSGASRILYSLAREGELPAWFARMHGNSLSPRNAMLSISLAVLLIAPLMAMPTISNCLSQLFSFHLAVVYACVLLAWIKMRHKKDGRGLAQPIHPVMAYLTTIVLIVISIGVLVEPGSAAMRGIVLAEAGLILSASFYLFRLKTTKN